MPAKASSRRRKTQKKAAIRARVTTELKKKWIAFVQDFGGDEDESTLLRRAVKEFMDRHGGSEMHLPKPIPNSMKDRNEEEGGDEGGRRASGREEK